MPTTYNKLSNSCFYFCRDGGYFLQMGSKIWLQTCGTHTWVYCFIPFSKSEKICSLLESQPYFPPALSPELNGWVPAALVH